MSDTVGMLGRLVAFDTTSSRSNLELIDYGHRRISSVRAPPSGGSATLPAGKPPSTPSSAIPGREGWPSRAMSTPSRSTASNGRPTLSGSGKKAASSSPGAPWT